MQHCSVCQSPNAREINEALKSNVADREVERRFPDVTRASISRHRRNHLGVGADDPAADPGLTPEVLPPLKQKNGRGASGGEIDIEKRKAIDQQRAVCAATWKVVDKALKKGNLGIAGTNLRNLTEAIKALAQHSGELQQPGLAVSVNIGRERWADSSLDDLRWALARTVARVFGPGHEGIEAMLQLAAAACPRCQRFDCQHDYLQ